MGGGAINWWLLSGGILITTWRTDEDKFWSMWKIAFVGHSHLPIRFNFPETEFDIFPSPGARAYQFFEGTQMSGVLSWHHDLTIVWIGSNDITSSTHPAVVFNHIAGICRATGDNCQSII